MLPRLRKRHPAAPPSGSPSPCGRVKICVANFGEGVRGGLRSKRKGPVDLFEPRTPEANAKGWGDIPIPQPRHCERSEAIQERRIRHSPLLDCFVGPCGPPRNDISQKTSWPGSSAPSTSSFSAPEPALGPRKRGPMDVKFSSLRPLRRRLSSGRASADPWACQLSFHAEPQSARETRHRRHTQRCHPGGGQHQGHPRLSSTRLLSYSQMHLLEERR